MNKNPNDLYIFKVIAFCSFNWFLLSYTYLKTIRDDFRNLNSYMQMKLIKRSENHKNSFSFFILCKYLGKEVQFTFVPVYNGGIDRLELKY